MAKSKVTKKTAKKTTKKTAKKAVKKTTRRAAAKRNVLPKEMVLVGSKVKAALRGEDVNVGEGTLEALNGILHWYLAQAALRTKANGRKTTRPHDVILMEMYDR